MDSWGLDTVWAGPFGSFLNMTFTYNKFDIHLHVTTLTNTCNPKPSDALQSTQDLCWLKSTVKVDNKSSQQRADGLSRAKTFVSYQTGYTFVIINVDCCRFPRVASSILTCAKSSRIMWCWNEKIALNVSLDISMVHFRVYALVRKYFYCNFEENFVWATHQYFCFHARTKRASVDQAYSCCCSPVLLFCWSFFVILMQLFVFLFTASYLLTDLQCKAVSRHCWLNYFEGQWSQESS